MQVVDRDYIESHKEEILGAIIGGAIFIYPTDTIYGLGANALLDEPVSKIRELKKRDRRAMSVVAPGKGWILDNCFVEEQSLDEYLPGPYTLFVRRKEGVVSNEVNPNDDTLGVRIPNHWFSELVAEAGVPFVTTSVNLSGEKHMEKLEDAPVQILEQIDYVVYEGEKKGTPSVKINLV